MDIYLETEQLFHLINLAETNLTLINPFLVREEGIKTEFKQRKDFRHVKTRYMEYSLLLTGSSPTTMRQGGEDKANYDGKHIG